MIQGIFYARFFPKEGTKIVAQSPPGCIVPVPGVDKPTLLDFSVLQEYIIPRKAFYNRYVTANDPEGRYVVLGFPVSIASPRYDRNEFIFNFGLVVGADVDQVPYERVVRRLAATFAEMEKQSFYLSRSCAQDEGGDGGGDGDVEAGGDGGGGGISSAADDAAYGSRRPIESLLEIVKEDLNNYGECMIPVDDANTLNMKLFPYHAPPPEVRGWHVPVAKMKFADVVDPTWDLTLQKVIAHIDGASDVRRIAWAADVSLPLACLALQHLLYYDTVLLLDMFFFGACYAPRPGIRDFVANVGGIVDECANYVCIGPGFASASASAPGGGGGTTASGGGATASGGGGGGGGGGDDLGKAPSSASLGGAGISIGVTGASGAGGGSSFTNPMGAAGSRGAGAGSGSGSGSSAGGGPQRRVSNYMLIKLMTTFCVGKTVMEWLKGHMDAGFEVLRYIDVRRLVQFGVIKGCLYRVHKFAVSKQYIAALATGQARPRPGGDPLQKYTDGCHCFDQIITEQNMTDAEIMTKLKRIPAPQNDLAVIYK